MEKDGKGKGELTVAAFHGTALQAATAAFEKAEAAGADAEQARADAAAAFMANFGSQQEVDRVMAANGWSLNPAGKCFLPGCGSDPSALPSSEKATVVKNSDQSIAIDDDEPSTQDNLQATIVAESARASVPNGPAGCSPAWPAVPAKTSSSRSSSANKGVDKKPPATASKAASAAASVAAPPVAKQAPPSAAPGPVAAPAAAMGPANVGPAANSEGVPAAADPNDSVGDMLQRFRDDTLTSVTESISALRVQLVTRMEHS